MKMLELTKNEYSIEALSEIDFDEVDVRGEANWHVCYEWQSGTETIWGYDQSSGYEDFKTVPCFETRKIDVVFTDDRKKNAEILKELIDKYIGEYKCSLNRGKK